MAHLRFQACYGINYLIFIVLMPKKIIQQLIFKDKHEYHNTTFTLKNWFLSIQKGRVETVKTTIDRHVTEYFIMVNISTSITIGERQIYSHIFLVLYCE